MDNIKVQLDPGAYMPERAHGWDAGADLRTPIALTVHSGASIVVDTGVHAQIPEGYVGMLKSKSGLNVNHCITTEGVIDAGYTGSIKVRIQNNGREHRFKAGDKITQLVILPVATPAFELVDSIEGGDRGDNGFGSTGR